jgi:ABC-type bacteriocin/lantibiotic exporter with double-glycine peptidase domain
MIGKALGQLVYAKIFKISAAGNHYMERDLHEMRWHNTWRVSRMINSLPHISSLPMLVFVCCYSMYSIIGNVIWIALAILSITLVVRYYMERLVSKLREKARKDIHERLHRTTGEVVEHAKLIKLNSWGDRFKDIIFGLHKKKACHQVLEHIINRLNSVIHELCHWSITLSVLITCVAYYEMSLSVAKTMLLWTCINKIKGHTSSLVHFMDDITEFRLGVKYLSRFLLCEEIDKNIIQSFVDENSHYAIEFNNCDFMWGFNKYDEEREKKKKEARDENESDSDKKITTFEDKIALQDIDLKIRKGEFVAIVGDVGSGKSSLIYSLLGEM